MSIRETLNRNQYASVAIIAVCFIAAAVIFLGFRGGNEGPSDLAYFYDLNTGEIVVEAVDALSPIQVDGKDARVLAQVISCTSCKDMESFQVAYVSKLSDQALEIAKRGGPSNPAEAQYLEGQGALVSTPERARQGEWISQVSPQAFSVFSVVNNLCDGGELKYCNP